MTQSSTRLGNYQADFQALWRGPGAGGPAWVRELGEQAWSRFSQSGFPTARRCNEKWKYTDVAPIAKTAFGYSSDLSPDGQFGAAGLRQIAPWQEEWVTLVFVDGRFSRSLSAIPESRDGPQVTGLAEAWSSDGRVVQRHLAQLARFEDDAFTALNTAFLSDGAFVYLPDGCVASQAVHLVYVTTGSDQPSVCYPRNLVVVGRDAGVTLVESYVGRSGAQYFTNAVTEIAVGEGSNVEHYRLLLESPQAFHVGTSRVRLDQDSSFVSASFAMGTTLARNDLQVLLDGPGASCFLNGLYLTGGAQHLDNLISIDHAKPHTTSRLNYKGILDGKSKAVFGGEVLVRKDAQKADAQQADKNLLLSAEAEADSKPSLLIDADDVKCSHGATAGHIDENSLFYIRSRGLDRETASRMLVHAFAREIVETVKLEPLQNYLDRLFLGAIPAASL